MKTRLPLALPAAFVALSALSPLAAGCNPANAALDAKSAHDTGKGTRKEYEATFDQAWAAAHAAIVWNKVGTVQDHNDDHYMITDPVRFDQIGIWVNPEGSNKTLVNVIVIDEPNLPGPNEEGVQKDVEKALALVIAGQPTDQRPK